VFSSTNCPKARSHAHSFRIGRWRWGDADFAAAAELRSAWTGEGARPYTIFTDEGVRPYTIFTANVESPEVMLNSFLSASSSRLDPC
jgi:hypothetical protein